MNTANDKHAASSTPKCVPPPEITVRTGNDPIAFDMLQQSLGRDAAREVLQTFRPFAAELLNELQNAIVARNAKAIHESLSELSSSCSVIGACSLLKCCILMEEELLKPDWERLERCMVTLIDESRVVGAFIKKLLS
jgi:HPt (histidine-containing phosphotransfer) domain-containing protein